MAKAAKNPATDLDDVVAAINKLSKKGQDAVAFAGRDHVMNDVGGYVSTGLPSFDAMLVDGSFQAGHPMGRIIEVLGPEDVGKSSLAYRALVSAQRGEGVRVRWKQDADEQWVQEVVEEKLPPGIGILWESENTFDVGRFARMGGDYDALLRIEAPYLELGFVAIERAVSKIRSKPSRAHLPIVIVCDTVSAIPDRAEYEKHVFRDTPDKKATKAGMAAKPRAMREQFRTFVGNLKRSQAVMIFVSQVSDQIGKWSPTGVTPVESTGCGRSIRYHSTIRCQLTSARRWAVPSAHDEEKEIIRGVLTRAVLRKTKGCTPWRKFTVPVGKDGVDGVEATLIALLDSPEVQKKNGKIRVKVGEEFVVCSERKFGETYAANPDFAAACLRLVRGLYVPESVR
jgi:RecA/RadA recombinase